MDRPEELVREKAIGRRTFLGVIGLGALGVLFGPRLQDALASVLRPVADVLPSGGRFRIYSVVGFLPSKATTDYRLRVDGLVDRPFELSFEELTASSPVALTRDFQCVTGWRVPGVRWRGVLLRDLLDRAGVQAGATAVRVYSFDGAYTESLTLDQARRDDVMAAFEMDGKTVSAPHGGPVRLLVTPMYGYKSLKWLERIEVTNHVFPGFWEERGYDVDAWVGKSNGRDDDPTS